MREIFDDIYDNQAADPMEAARRAMRPPLRKRFYTQAAVGEGVEEGFPVTLDAKPVRTPLRRLLAAPAPGLAEAIAAEWNAQEQVIDPGRMPLTRLANAVIDAVADAPGPVAGEVEKYLGSDLVCYRADAPAGLVDMQGQAWDPVLTWAHEALGARFVQVQGVMHAAQPREAIAAARAAIPPTPGGLARCRRSPRSPGRRSWRWRWRTATSMRTRLGPPRMWTRTGRWRNGAATR